LGQLATRREVPAIAKHRRQPDLGEMFEDRIDPSEQKMQHGSRRHFDGMDVLAIQIKIIEGRQSDQRYRHFAEHGRQYGRRPLEILSPTTGHN
jgi:hypothetical protein